MLFRRIAFLGLALAAVSAAVLQIRLMHGASLREVHLLLSEQTELQRQIARQDLELAQLRVPWRVAARLSTLGVPTDPPGPERESPTPRPLPTNTGSAATPARFVNHTLGSGGAAPEWPSRPAHNSRPNVPR